jgi:hypothetical protein
MEAKRDYFCSKLKDSNSDQKQLYSIANTLLHRTKTRKLPTFTEPETMAERFADYFNDKIQKIRDTFKLDTKDASAAFANDTNAAATLCDFKPTDEKELKKIIMSSKSKSCVLDPIPTTLLKSCIDCLLPTLVNIVNSSLSTSTFPTCYKSAIVTPLLQKDTLDP